MAWTPAPVRGAARTPASMLTSTMVLLRTLFLFLLTTGEQNSLVLLLRLVEEAFRPVQDGTVLVDLYGAAARAAFGALHEIHSHNRGQGVPRGGGDAVTESVDQVLAVSLHD